MLTRKILFAAALLLLIANPVFAVTPENGWWWNPSESGRGFNIEIQKDTVFIATFIYDVAGNPIWYSGSGKLQNSQVAVTLKRFEGGQCIGCSYKKPITMDALGHPILVSFTSPTMGTVTWQGEEKTPIQRFNFKLGDDNVKLLLGEWVFMSKIPATSDGDDYIGDRIVLDQVTKDEHEGDDVEGTITGHRKDVPDHTTVINYDKDFQGTYKYHGSTQYSHSRNLSIAIAFNLAGVNRLKGVAIFVPTTASDSEQQKILEQAITGHEAVPFDAYRAPASVSATNAEQDEHEE